MKDDVAAPNLGQANKEFDAQYFWTTYRTIEQWMQQTTSKGNVSVASLTADTLAVEDVVVSGDITIEGDALVEGSASVTGDLTVTGTITGDLTGNVTGNVTGDLTGDVTGNLTGNVTGNLTGDVTGDVTGNVTGNLTGNVTGNLTGNLTGDTTVGGHLTPTVTATYNLGSSSLRWGTIYTSDLSLKNDVGDWTIVEGADDLFITNNKNGKRYRFALVEVEDAD